MTDTQTLDEIEVLKSELDAACDALLNAAQRGLQHTSEVPLDATKLMDVFAEILSLCAFQDLAGQRLDRLARRLMGTAADNRPDANLLNGPADADGLDQAAADALFGNAFAR